MNDSSVAPASLPSIRQYLVSRILGIVVLSFAVFSAAAYFIVVRPAQDEIARAEMGRAAEQVEGRVLALVGQIERVLLTAQQLGRTGGLVRIDRPQEFAALMIPFLKTREQISEILFADAQGRSLQIAPEARGGWLVRVTDAGKLPGRQYWIHFNGDGGYVGEEWVDTKYDARSRPWFQGAVQLPQDDAIHWTEPYVFFGRNDVGITASMRWNERNTGARQVIGLDVQLLDLSRETSRITIGTHGRAAILTDDGRILGVPRHPLIVTEDDIKSRLLKSPREAGFLAHAAALEQWIGRRPSGGAGCFF